MISTDFCWAPCGQQFNVCNSGDLDIRQLEHRLSRVMELSYLTGGMQCSEWIIQWVKSYLACKAELVHMLWSPQSFD